ncbi:cellulase family glycosylhydrolase [Spartinivicinus sp. A2-2]|uniref:Cellulase family glycosylhydrolase n=2 Tax=Spartinivicinus poritis TaxID=2994640 RepID=A0ABT5U6M9_9GAMM|nr:cellulase family glycosylhydrolase [Spartinivicinus sp. A2-2]MDE1461113.1 cellulase family glycosylhydrolase [Spartinivicinus sp. A2-2]
MNRLQGLVEEWGIIAAVILLILMSVESSESNAVLTGAGTEMTGNANAMISQAAFTPSEKMCPAQKGSVDRYWTLTDESGREAYWQGFNVSGSVKLAETGFKPFKNLADAQQTFQQIKQQTGANIVRFTLAWEGVQPEPNVIDYQYLADITAQLKQAIDQGIYVILDYHQDLFSRHLFNQKSWHTGNGAPAWVVPDEDYPPEYCGPVCFSWSQHNITDKAVRLAFRRFWADATVETTVGPIKIQTAFLDQLAATLDYIRKQLSSDELSYMLGVDPFNEPVDGGMEGLSPKEWDNQVLWPFYLRVRQVMDNAGWQQQYVYAEPLVFWNTNAGVVRPTGGHHLNQPPGKGFIFNSHYYDAARMSWRLLSVKSGSYIDAFDQIRQEASFLQLPLLVSEFGMWLHGKGSKDPIRMLKGQRQGMALSKLTDDKRPAFCSPFISATQWHWDIYYNNHHEYQNGNPDKLITKWDAWNDENFSVVSNYGNTFNLPAPLLQRAYPERIAGQLWHSYFNDITSDKKGRQLHWVGIKPLGSDSVKWQDKLFFWATWQGKGSGDSWFYLPTDMAKNGFIVLTEQYLLSSDQLTEQKNRDIQWLPSTKGPLAAGGRLVVKSQKAKEQFLLVIPKHGANTMLIDWPLLQNRLQETVVSQLSPLVLL